MEPNNKETKYILFDTNVIQYLTSEKVALPLFKYLHPLFNVYKPSISDISVCEHLSGLSSQDEKSKNYIFNYDHFKIETNVLVGAARLQNIYRQESSDLNSVELGDRLIAATSIIYNLPIVTANVLHFPRPFFSEVDGHIIEYEYNKGRKSLFIQILHPNTAYINLKLLEYGYIA